MLLAFLLRAALSVAFWITDAIFLFRLSPDGERYHRVGIWIMREMERGFFNWPNWVDNGWFQFTGLVYFLFGPYAGLIQLLNVILGVLTVAVVYFLALEVSQSSHVARISAFLVAVFPSFVFWSCLMIKDPAAILAMTLLVLCTVKLRKKFGFGWLLLLIGALLTFLGIREYMFFMATGMIALSILLFPPTTRFSSGSWIVLIALAFVPMVLSRRARSRSSSLAAISTRTCSIVC